MSIVRNRRLKKLGITSRKQKREARRYVHTFPKCNKGFAYNNFACNIGLLNSFWKYGHTISIHK